MPTVLITAAVVEEQGAPFELQTLALEEPRPHEVLVRVVAAGLRRTDLHIRDGHLPASFPVVPGHEGVGVVKRIGQAVDGVAPGDRVVMSYPFCGQCRNCLRAQNPYCAKGFDLCFSGRRADGSTALHRRPAENVVFHHSPDLLGGVDWHGREGFQGWNQKMSEPNETVRVEDSRYFPDRDNHLVSLMLITQARHRDLGRGAHNRAGARRRRPDRRLPCLFPGTCRRIGICIKPAYRTVRPPVRTPLALLPSVSELDGLRIGWIKTGGIGVPDQTVVHARPTRAEVFTERLSVEVVNASFEGTGDPRLRELLASLVRHLHAFVKDVALTGREWAEAVEFLTAVGQTCDGVRQEMILLSDVLGLSMLVETINHRTGGTSTEATILGPFHMVDSPVRELGDNIAVDGKGEPCLITGTITGPDGEPIGGASVDVWQANDEGFYDVQQPDVQPALNLRGLFRADSAGRFWFRTIVPRYYPIPTDGPVGRLLHATQRHPNRPAHVHFVVNSPGYRKVTTHLFVANSPYIDSDAVFGVKDSLVRSFPLVDDSSRAAEFGLTNPFRAVQFDVSLRAEDLLMETVSGSEKTP